MLHFNTVQRSAGSNEQRSEIVATETDVGRVLRNVNLFQFLPIGVEDVNTTSVGGVKVALDVNGHAVATLTDMEQLFPQLAIFIHHITVDAGRELLVFGIRMSIVATSISNIEPVSSDEKTMPLGMARSLTIASTCLLARSNL